MTGDEIKNKEDTVFGELSDMGMASKVRMLYRTDLDHEATVTGARDRIIYLSQSLHKAHLRLTKARTIIQDMVDGLNSSNWNEAKVWLENKEVSYSVRDNELKISKAAYEHALQVMLNLANSNGDLVHVIDIQDTMNKIIASCK